MNVLYAISDSPCFIFIQLQDGMMKLMRCLMSESVFRTFRCTLNAVTSVSAPHVSKMVHQLVRIMELRSKIPVAGEKLDSVMIRFPILLFQSFSHLRKIIILFIWWCSPCLGAFYVLCYDVHFVRRLVFCIFLLQQYQWALRQL